MNGLMIAKTYLVLNALLALSYFAIAVFQFWQERKPERWSKTDLLRLAYTMIGSSCLASVVVVAFSSSSVFKPTTQIWAAETSKWVHFSKAASNPEKVAISVGSSITSIRSEAVIQVVLVLLFLGFGWVGLQLVKDMKSIKLILESSSKLKSIGGITLAVSSREIIPFSFWIPFRAYVIVPQSLIESSGNLKIVLAHEMQHHRQLDTKWVYGIQAVRALCFWNPFVHLLERVTTALQEFACDESVVGRHAVSSTAYCDCLLWVAQKNMQARQPLVGTASFAAQSAASLLKRRIEIMLKGERKKRKNKHVIGVATATLLTFGAIAHAAGSSIQDRRVSVEQAEEMATVARNESTFPIEVNELVLEQLNRYLGTPDGRDYMRRSIARMEGYEGEITTQLDKYGLPHELLAVPIIESGYKNIAQDSNPLHGAGIWMFIASTAKKFGLRVDDTVDERLNTALETDAAMRALSGLNFQFRDWRLALMGYNCGPKLVEKGIEKTGSRDPWTLVRQGYQNDKGYLASIMAAVIILKNPSVLD